MFPKGPSGGNIWSPIRSKFGRNVDSTWVLCHVYLLDTYDENLGTDSAIRSEWVIELCFFPRCPPGGHIWNPIGPKFGRKVDGA
jgi:hypothetical protein